MILAINGQEVSLDEKLYEFIGDKQGREFEFLVNTNTDIASARKVKYRVLSDGEWSDINYRNRIDRLRKYVEEKSGGKVGYLPLAAMSMSNQIKFEREAYEYMAGKEGMMPSGENVAEAIPNVWPNGITNLGVCPVSKTAVDKIKALKSVFFMGCILISITPASLIPSPLSPPLIRIRSRRNRLSVFSHGRRF